MGASGIDVKLSKEGIRRFPFAIECKSHASFATYTYYDQARSNTGEGQEPLLIIKANNRRPLAIVDAEWFIKRMK